MKLDCPFVFLWISSCSKVIKRSSLDEDVISLRESDALFFLTAYALYFLFSSASSQTSLLKYRNVLHRAPMAIVKTRE